MANVATEMLTVTGPRVADADRVLTRDALDFIARLHLEFNPERERLLAERQARWRRIAAGDESLGLLDETKSVRDADWRVAPAPRDLDDRRVEITGPVERKMMINALNSGANVFMADFEDALSPTWENVVGGQGNVIDAARRRISLDAGGKHYALNPAIATLVIRPRGWHLAERHVLVDGAAVSASLFDFGLAFFHNAREQLGRGTGPYFYLPKMQSHREARLWNRVFTWSQQALGVPHGSVRATVLIETIFAAFEMEEILYELRDHAAGLNAGRWDYLFSIIKTFRTRSDMILPDRAQLTMAVPFMRAYAQRLVDTCHRRGAHAIGGMAAFIPSRKDAEVNERALARVREDKLREAGDGFDGTWVAHPDLVAVAREVFDRTLQGAPNQKHARRDGPPVDVARLLDLRVDGGAVTSAGVETNVDVALQYLAAWLDGQGAVAIHNLMEDAATAEISRSQLWQWVRHGTMGANEYARARDRILPTLREGNPDGRWSEAAALLDRLVLGEFEDFLTLPGYELLVRSP